MKLWFRFSLYFALGLFLFTIYLCILFPLLLHLLAPESSLDVFAVVENAWHAALVLFLFAVCFVTGGLLFSVFFVLPFSQIITAIQGIADGKGLVNAQTMFTGSNRLKVPYRLYREVIAGIRQLDRALRRAEQDRAVVETAKRDWLAGVSHDLKTPLSYITGYATLLLTPGAAFTRQETRQHLEDIYRKGVFIEAMIDDLSLALYLDTDGALPLCRRDVDLVALVQKLVSDAAGAPEAPGHDFSFITPETELNLSLDSALMSRALGNLLANCVEHTPAGSHVTVTLILTDACADACADARAVHLILSDDGGGMSPDTLAHCFTRYYSKHGPGRNDSGHGKGMGLFIARSIAEAHGGCLDAESAPGAGSSFRLILPDNRSAGA